MKYDKIILGAGIYGLYAALFCGNRGEKILVIECDAKAFGRATYINQARVHMGYHYPRSLSTAMKSAGYFERFNKDLFVSIGNLIRCMLHLRGCPGVMLCNLKNSVKRPGYPVRK